MEKKGTRTFLHILPAIQIPILDLRPMFYAQRRKADFDSAKTNDFGGRSPLVRLSVGEKFHSTSTEYTVIPTWRRRDAVVVSAAQRFAGPPWVWLQGADRSRPIQVWCRARSHPILASSLKQGGELCYFFPRDPRLRLTEDPRWWSKSQKRVWKDATSRHNENPAQLRPTSKVRRRQAVKTFVKPHYGVLIHIT